MKKINFLVSMVTAMILLCGTSAYAQTNVSSDAQLITAVTSLSGTGGTIKLVAPFTNPTVSGATWADNALAIGSPTHDNPTILQANAPITIDCGDNKMTVYCGDNSSGVAGNLVIGANITVTGSGAVTIDNVNRGILEVKDGGTVINTCLANGVAVNASAGRSVVDDGGTIMTTSPNGIGMKCGNSFTTIINGGEISAGADGATALLLDGTPGTNYAINNVYIHAVGTDVVGLKTQNGWSVILYNVVVETSSTDGSDIGIMVTGGGGGQSGGVVLLPESPEETATLVYAATPYVATNLASVIDMNNMPITITANPAAGKISIPSDVVLTAKYADGTPVAASIVTSMDDIALSLPAGGVFPDGVFPSDNNAPVTVSDAGTLNAAVCVVSTYGTKPATPPDVSDGIPSQLLGSTSFTYTGGGTGIPNISADNTNAYIADNVLFTPAGKIQLYGVSGQLILDTVATGTGIDVSTLAKGVYIVKAGALAYKVVK